MNTGLVVFFLAFIGAAVVNRIFTIHLNTLFTQYFMTCPNIITYRLPEFGI